MSLSAIRIHTKHRRRFFFISKGKTRGFAVAAFPRCLDDEGLAWVVAEHGIVVALEEDERREERETHDDEPDGHVAVRGREPREEEDEAPAHGTHVSPGTHHPRNRSLGLWHHRGDNRVGGALGGLYEHGEADEHGDGRGDGLHAAEDDEHDPLKEEADHLGDEAPAHLELLVGKVGEHASEGAGEEVHEAEAHGDRTRAHEAETELVHEVRGHGVVHRELDSEAARVLSGQHPARRVSVALLGRRGGRHLRLGARLDQVYEVAARAVVREDKDRRRRQEEEDGGNDERQAPRRAVASAPRLHGLEHQRHEQLRDAAARVAPPAADGLRLTDDVGGKHGRAPVLRGHKSGADDADEEPDDDEARGAVDERAQSSGDGAPEEDAGLQAARPVLVAHGADEEAREDGHEHGCDVGGPHVGISEAEIFFDHGHQRCQGEPAEEGHEEGEPRHVERDHVWACAGEDLHLRCRVALLGVHFEEVGELANNQVVIPRRLLCLEHVFHLGRLCLRLRELFVGHTLSDNGWHGAGSMVIKVWGCVLWLCAVSCSRT
mmetsp:Transcript_35195/g.69909  ORF Transcript_35195/g.69909 Transcript_35195/m.69909 type:complete len:548 (-) Transcript_35195:24-1667(-)